MGQAGLQAATAFPKVKRGHSVCKAGKHFIHVQLSDFWEYHRRGSSPLGAPESFLECRYWDDHQSFQVGLRETDANRKCRVSHGNFVITGTLECL